MCNTCFFNNLSPKTVKIPAFKGLKSAFPFEILKILNFFFKKLVLLLCR